VKKIKVTFEQYYSEQCGGQWPLLKKALLEERNHFDLHEGLKQSYFLDPASVQAGKALQINEGDRVLDLCAAPGGKSLVLAQNLKPGATLKCNEKSPARRQRLIKVLDDHLDTDLRTRVDVSGFDATKWCLFEQEMYEKILLDAPCSSEGHVLQSPKHLNEWSPSRIKRLAQQQFAMVASALELLVVGGEMVYSTCAIAEDENDGVIEKLFKKRAGRFELLPIHESIGYETKFGWKMWPDTDAGVGPIYYTRLKKLS